MNPEMQKITDWLKARSEGAVAAMPLLLLLLAPAGCNDGGIVGTGSGAESAADKQPTEIGNAPALDAAASPGLPSATEQEMLCEAIPETAPATLLGAKNPLTVQEVSNGDTSFSCTWQVTSLAVQKSTGIVTVTIDSSTRLWESVTGDITGKYIGPDTAVLNNGYIIHSSDGCHQGIIIPPENGLTVSAGYENPASCQAGTDHRPATTLAALNRLAKDTLNTLQNKPH